MTKLSTAEFAGRALIAVGIAALAALLWRLSDIFILVFGGIVLAAVLRSVMHIVERWTPVRRTWALLAAILLLIGAVVLIGVLIGPRVSTQMAQLSKTLPSAWESARNAINASPVGRGALLSLQSQATLERSMSQLGNVASVTLGALVDIGVMLFTGLYFAVDPLLYQRGLLRLVPPSGKPHVQRALNSAGGALSRWLKGVVLSMISIGLVSGLGLWLLGVPLALALGLLAGLFEFIPYVGAIMAAIPAILVAFSLGPTKAEEVVGLYLAVHLFEGELLVPLIQRWTVELPPAVGILSVVVFGWLFGLPGIIFATPLTVVIIALVESLYVESALKSSGSAT